MKVEIPLGDVVDRVTILRLKEAHLTEPARRANVRAELRALRDAWDAAGLPPMVALSAFRPLAVVNARLWRIEDALREHERARRFDADFVALARAVYRLNDRRAALKREIDVALGSRLVEEKTHPTARAGRSDIP